MLRAVKLIAHRGASHEAPENTLAAIHLAWQERADGVEIDVRQTIDGRVVVIHDESAKRTTGRDLIVADQMWEILRPLDAGSWKGPRWRHAGIPLLREVLKVIPSSRRLYVEIKAGAEIVPQLAGDLQAVRPALSSLCFLGFNPATLQAARRAMPDVDACLNVEPRGTRGAPADWTAAGLVALVRQWRLTGLSVGWCEAVDEAFVRAVAAAGMPLAVWTVDDEHVAQRLMDWGLPMLITNKPGYLRHKLHRRGSP